MILPQRLIRWTFNQNRPTVVSTSFGNHSAVLLDMVHQIKPDATILWLDTQFNTRATLTFKELMQHRYNLNIVTYRGELWQGTVPTPDVPEFEAFVDQVKLAPFRKAMEELSPIFWISGIRREQTEFRRQTDHINHVGGIVKISPLLEWTAQDMERYLNAHSLPNEPNYFDPTKPDEHTECGLHTKELK